jgi:hypothetical protein
LHEKVPTEIQFAVLSDDSSLDPLVRFINEAGRNCLRVKRSLATDEPTTPTPAPTSPTKIQPIVEPVAVQPLKVVNKALSMTSMSANESLLPDIMMSLSMQEEIEEDMGEISFLDDEVMYHAPAERIELIKPMENHLEYDHVDADIHKKAMDIIEKLVQSGNRPSEVSLLKYYALQHHENLGKNGTLQRVIEHLEKTRYISLEESEITYHF